MNNDTVSLALLALACWRISNLVANEEGPYKMFLRLRVWAKMMCARHKWCRDYGLYDMLNCEYCNSMYIAPVLVFLYWRMGYVFNWVLLPLAISTCVILLKKTHEKLGG